MKNKYILTILTLVFLLMANAIYFFLDFENKNKASKFIEAQLVKYTNQYEAIYHEYHKMADMLFQTKINKEEILKLYDEINRSSDIEKNIIRDKLYKLLKSDYYIMTKFYLKHFNFYLPNNENFLRFHIPSKFGDNLSQIRDTVKFVNENRKKIEGFEIGRTFDGYRFVYPLFYKKNYIGSVGLSFNTDAIVSEYMHHYLVNAKFLVSKEIIDKKVIGDEKNYYKQSKFKGFYIDEDSDSYKLLEKQKESFKISKESREYISQNIIKAQNFTKYDYKNDKLFIVIPINNPVTKQAVAAIVIEDNDEYIKNKNLNYTVASFIFIGLLGVIFIIIYFELIAKIKLKENNEKLQTVIDEADSGIAIIDLDGKFLEVNQICISLLGFSSDELKGLNCTDLSKEDLKKILQEAKLKGSLSKYRTTFITKAKENIHLEISLNLLPNEKKFVCVLNSLEDKIALEKALNKFEHIFKFTSVGFLIVNENREIIEVNPKLLEMTGYKRAEIIGKSSRIFYKDDKSFKESGEQIYLKAVLNKNVKIENEYRKKDGSTIWLEVSGSPLNDRAKLENGGVLWAVVDITETVRSRELITKQNEYLQDLNENLNDEVESQIEKIREQDKILIQKAKMASMGEMMDAVSHQWKQPLNIIKMSSDEIDYMLEDDTLDKSYLDKIRLRIRDQINHMSETLDEFREFFRPKDEYELVSLKKVIDSALVLMKDELVKYTIMTKFIGEDSLKVKLVPNEFKHVIINLVNNAKEEYIIKNIKNRVITFEVSSDDLFVILSVKDTAGGIPDEIIDHIFKADVTTKEEGMGTGIGLYMCKNIIEKIGGSIEVKNIENGAEFIVRIPV